MINGKKQSPQFAIEDDEKGKMGRVWLRKTSDTFIRLGHIACILEDARRVYPTPFSREVQAWWQRALQGDEPILVYDPPLEAKEAKKAYERHHNRTKLGVSVTEYDYEQLKDLVEAFEFAEVS